MKLFFENYFFLTRFGAAIRASWPQHRNTGQAGSTATAQSPLALLRQPSGVAIRANWHSSHSSVTPSGVADIGQGGPTAMLIIRSSMLVLRSSATVPADLGSLTTSPRSPERLHWGRRHLGNQGRTKAVRFFVVCLHDHACCYESRNCVMNTCEHDLEQGRIDMYTYCQQRKPRTSALRVMQANAHNLVSATRAVQPCTCTPQVKL